jgi:hypothetical protein
MPVKRMKGAKARCDTLYSLIIRSSGECLKCGYRCPCDDAPKAHRLGCKLTTSHIIGRRYSGTRTLELNGQPLCFSCHRRFEDWPREFSHWITETIGSDNYDELVRRSQTVTKMDWDAEVERLLVVAKSLGIK